MCHTKVRKEACHTAPAPNFRYPHHKYKVKIGANFENESFSLNVPFTFSGDGDYKPFVSADPDVTTVEMNGSEDYLIIACDGLWDTVSPGLAAETVLECLQKDKGTLK